MITRRDRSRIRDMILKLFDEVPALSDRQLLYAFRVAMPKTAKEGTIVKIRRELTASHRLVRCDRVLRQANGRLVNLYAKRGGPTRARGEIPF